MLLFPNFLSLEMYVPSITQKFPSHPPQIGELSLDCRRPSNPVNANFISQNLSTVFLRLCLNLYLSNTSNITGRQNHKHNKTRNARLSLSLCQRLWSACSTRVAACGLRCCHLDVTCGRTQGANQNLQSANCKFNIKETVQLRGVLKKQNGHFYWHLP